MTEELRIQALEMLGVLASPLAREALEHGVVEVKRDVLEWTGTGGTVHGHRVTLGLEPGLHGRVLAAPAVVDDLTAAFAAAIARTSGNSLADLELRSQAAVTRPSTPYRGRI